MKKIRDCGLVLLVLNEIEGLKKVWDALPLDEFSITVAVDGGSTDGSREFLADRGIPILDQTIKGRGVAFRVGVHQGGQTQQGRACRVPPGL